MAIEQPPAELLPPSGSPGRLKIFFGYADGTGKTADMLRQAVRAAQNGTDVLVGAVAPRTKGENCALLARLAELAPAPPAGTPGTAPEFDLDQALERRPALILLENLAHDNAPGSRHQKRYQDVQELLRAGIGVYTTLNVENLESLNDQIVDITGSPARERIPDPVFDAADAVELADRDPAELLAGECLPGIGLPSLTALRGLALRRMADHTEHIPQGEGELRPRQSDHILICLSGAPSNTRVIRAASRMAEVFHGGFTALFVEPPDFGLMGAEERGCLRNNLRLAEQLGARIATMYGDDPAVQIAEYARLTGINKIVLGRSVQQRRLLIRHTTLVDRLSTLAPDMDIYIIPDQNGKPISHHRGTPPVPRLSPASLGKTAAILALCTLIGFALVGLGLTVADIILIYVVGVLGVALVTDRRIYSLAASVLAMLIFNFFFTRPYLAFIRSPGDLAALGVMLLVALLGSSLALHNKQQAAQNARKAYRTEVLLETSRMLQKAEDAPAIYAAAATQLRKLLERDVLLYPAGEKGELLSPLRYPVASGDALAACLSPHEQETARWVLKNNKHAGATTSTLSDARCLYMAVRGSGRALAVAGVRIDPANRPDAFEKDLMVAILDECGLALEKENMMRAKQRVEETAHQEALRANLLRAISHDLRTPLTSVSGNAGILLENGEALDTPTRQRLYGAIYDDAMWLISLVENLLSITRIENGAMKLNVQPELLDEVFHEAVLHLDRNAARHEITATLADELLMAPMDARLIVQVIINLLNNAIKYTPDGSHIRLTARRSGRFAEVSVADDGPGIPPEGKGRLFEMFYTASHAGGDSRRGLGLGLALCRSIVAAHGGTIWQEDVAPHGTCFRFTLPAMEVNQTDE